MEAYLLIVSLGILTVVCTVLIFLFLKQKRISDSIKEKAKIWKGLAESIPDILIRINKHLIIEYINPASDSILKNPPIDYLLKSINNLFENENISGVEGSEIEKLFNSGKQLVKEVTFKHSHSESLEFRFLPELGENNEINNILIIGRNITEQKRAQEKLRIAKHEAEDSDRLKSAFLANMSHEIRTPLNAIVGFSNIILEDDLTMAEKAKYFTYINQSSNQLISLINDIIDISKIQSQQLSIHKSEFNLNQHLKEIEEIIINEKQNRDKNHLLVFVENELSDNLSDIFTDPYRLRQIIINLLVNAIKFTPKGFIQFGYRVLEKSKILFYVRDSGIGISENDQKIIFQHFRQVDNSLSRKYGGTGLGLAICENLVELMGGKIWLKSEKGKGTTFYFTIQVDGLSKIQEKMINLTTDQPKKKNIP